jgi:cyclopropane fatty-acyl-phospholipid synthase-like methyltransferase
MTLAPGSEAAAVLQQSLGCLASGTAEALVGPATVEFSERCVEVPWVAAHLGNTQRLLDVGWAMSPPEWLGVLLAVEDRGCQLTGIDIVDPQRVRTRYPDELRDRVLSVTVRVQSVLDAQPVDGLYDTITCVSTLEHIGFDIASAPDVTDTAFVRAKTAEEATMERDPATDRAFLDAAARLLEPGGSVLISVPAGHGVPILHQDSLGLFTHQFEYDAKAWDDLLADERFEVTDTAFFRHDDEAGWESAATFDALTDQTSALRPFATACAMVSMRLR